MKITESIGKRGEIWQSSTKIIKLNLPDEINKDSITWRQKKEPGKAMSGNYRE